MVVEVAGVNERADSIATSLCLSPVMRVCNLLVELLESVKAVEKLDIVCIVIEVGGG